jgi:hypothetical protein
MPIADTSPVFSKYFYQDGKLKCMKNLIVLSVRHRKELPITLHITRRAFCPSPHMYMSMNVYIYMNVCLYMYINIWHDFNLWIWGTLKKHKFSSELCLSAASQLFRFPQYQISLWIHCPITFKIVDKSSKTLELAPDCLCITSDLPVFFWNLASSRLISWNPEDGDSKFLRNVGSDLLVYTALKPSRTSSSSSSSSSSSL